MPHTEGPDVMGLAGLYGSVAVAQTFWAPGRGCRLDGMNPTSRPMPVTNVRMSGPAQAPPAQLCDSGAGIEAIDLEGREKLRAECKVVFWSRHRKPYTRHGVIELVKRAGARVPELERQKVTPHTLRHSSTCHLLRAGVYINTIRA